MIALTREQIEAMTTNPNVVVRARKLVERGQFEWVKGSRDDTWFEGASWTGKRQKRHYLTSVDLENPEKPVFACDCTVRRKPCVHMIALLLRVLEEEGILLVSLPEEVEEARAARKAETARSAILPLTDAQQTAWKKKIQRQLDGLEIADQMLTDMVRGGLSTVVNDAQSWKELVSQLGDYYLQGPQRLFRGLIEELEDQRRDGKDSHLDTAVSIVEELWTLIQEGDAYLQDQLGKGEPGRDDNPMYEALGGVWQMEEFRRLRLVRENVRLTQLAFWVTSDHIRKTQVQTGCWADLDTGELYVTHHYRPWWVKNPPTVDSVFGMVSVPEIAVYPGEGNRRIRWSEETPGELTGEDLQFLRSQAGNSLDTVIRNARNLLKDPLNGDMLCVLFRYHAIGRAGDHYVVQDESGLAITLADKPGMEASARLAGALPDPALLRNQVMLGAVWYNRTIERICIQPLSLLTETSVIRLLY